MPKHSLDVSGEPFCQLDVVNARVVATFSNSAELRAAIPTARLQHVSQCLDPDFNRQSCAGSMWAWKKDVPADEASFVAFCRAKQTKQMRLDRGVQLCGDCHTEKPLDQFHMNGPRYRYNCKECHGRKGKADKKRQLGRFGRMMNDSKSHSKRVLAAGRLQASENTLTIEQMLEQWNMQKGMCLYSSIPLHYDATLAWACSLERIDDERGYVADNVAFICREFNVRAKWTVEKVLAVPLLMQQQVDTERLEHDVLEASTKMPVELNANAYVKELRFKVYRLMVNAHASAKARASIAKRAHTDVGTVTINEKTLFDKIIAQGGRCAISGIPLRFERNVDWKISLERLDNDKGYTPENTVLVCAEFNGACQWTREKFQHFLSVTTAALK